jgi:hypothetical protein
MKSEYIYSFNTKRQADFILPTATEQKPAPYPTPVHLLHRRADRRRQHLEAGID